MSLSIRLFDLALRATVKRSLARLETPEQMRRGVERAAALAPPPPRAARFHAEALDGGPEPASRPRLTWCHWSPDDPAPRWRGGPAILYLHGGAYVAGSPKTHRSILWPLARASGLPVAALDYRLAPEHPFPAAFEDAGAAWRALLARGAAPGELGLAGDSAGGGLALCLAAALDAGGARDAAPGAVAAFSGFFDLTLSGGSMRENVAADAMLPAHRIPELVERLLAGADPKDPRISPLFANWRAPAPTLLHVGARELLRDDSLRLAERLRAAGGAVTLRVHPLAPHAWHIAGPVLPDSRRALDEAGRFLAEHVGAAARRAPASHGAEADAAG